MKTYTPLTPIEEQARINELAIELREQIHKRLTGENKLSVENTGTIARKTAAVFADLLDKNLC